MTKNNISNQVIVEISAKLANRVGLENLSLKMIAEELNVKSPSLYNYFSSLKDIKKSLMFYGWKQLEEKIIDSAVGVSGYEALKNMCYAFYDYAMKNKGIFDAMLWYNKYDNEETIKVTKRLYELMFKVTATLNIDEKNTRHIIRTIRSFLEGFVLLVNNNSFGNQISVKESFDISLEILINGIKILENKKEENNEE